MITASHLPKDRNGLKIFTKNGGYTKSDISELTTRAATIARQFHASNTPIPNNPPTVPTVDFFPHYAGTLRDAILSEVCTTISEIVEPFSDDECDIATYERPLAGLHIVLNAGHGSGALFHSVLEELGADVTGSIGVVPDETFPNGVPNPESKDMVFVTKRVCEEIGADIGVMLDTDADRSGFVLPREMTGSKEGGASGKYEALNGNRLIALLGVVFKETAPGCTFVTDSVTSEGLSTFLEGLGIHHYRFVRGYANVIGKAMELDGKNGVDAQVAIETSGHCAMKENGYLDDGTYTAVRVIGFLARMLRLSKEPVSLLDLINDMEEMEIAREVRLTANNGDIETTRDAFELCEKAIDAMCQKGAGWELDSENREGIRVRTSGGQDGSFFMIRCSLHDPVLSLYMEGSSISQVKEKVVGPLLKMFKEDDFVREALDISLLEDLATSADYSLV